MRTFGPLSILTPSYNSSSCTIPGTFFVGWDHRDVLRVFSTLNRFSYTCRNPAQPVCRCRFFNPTINSRSTQTSYDVVSKLRHRDTATEFTVHCYTAVCRADPVVILDTTYTLNFHKREETKRRNKHEQQKTEQNKENKSKEKKRNCRGLRAGEKKAAGSNVVFLLSVIMYVCVSFFFRFRRPRFSVDNNAALHIVGWQGL